MSNFSRCFSTRKDRILRINGTMVREVLIGPTVFASDNLKVVLKSGLKSCAVDLLGKFLAIL